jgi:PAS domain S-box-containing protein
MAVSSLPWQPVKNSRIVLFLAAVLGGLLLTSLHSYLLFHSMVEMFSVVVSFAMFTVFWNSRRYLNDNWLVLLGIGFLSVGALDFVHMLAFKGMGVFDADADLATQIWVAARYTEGFTLLAALLMRNRRIRVVETFLLYGATTTALLGGIFSGNFPTCFDPDSGLTPFKVVSEVVVCVLLALSLLLLVRNRRQFSPEVFRLLAAAIIISIVSEVTFTTYVSAFDLANAAGHLLKVVAVYLLYKIFVEQGLRQPYSLLFRDLKRRESALRESEEEMRLITDSMPALISYVDAEGYYRFANRAYEEWFGGGGKGVVGRHAREVLGEDIFTTLLPYMERVVRGESVAYERKVTGERGDRHVHAELVPRFDERKRVVGFFALVHDMTERVRAEEALRKSESEYRALFELAGSAKGQTDATTKRFIRVNRRFCEITGYSEEELLQMTSEEVTHPDDRVHDRELYEQVVAGNQTGWSVEKRYVRKDGRIIWVQVTGTLIRGDDGRPLHTVAAVNDVTDRKHFEDKLRESEERFRVAITHAGIIVTTQDADLRYTWAYNTRMFKPEQILGKLDSDLLPPEDAERLMGVKRRVLATGEGARVVVEAAADGEKRVFDLAIQPLRDASENVVGLTTAAFDITEQKRIEQELRLLTQTLEERVVARTADLERSQAALRQSERLAAIGQMITGLSHESRNALQRNRACIELLMRRFQDNSQAMPLLEEAARAQADLQRVHDEVRDYSGPITLERSLQPLSDVWREAWAHLEPLRAKKEGVLIERVECGDTIAAVDRFRMRQVFRNLLENSLAACDAPATITLSCTDAELGGKPARRISVRDNGPGLTEEQAKRIFEPFYTTKTKGTGLGMAIVKRIVESHEGRIEIYPNPGQGLEVILTVPCG